jgi:ABC-type multidrug transport system fused ATPase/permease subunit
MENHNPETRAAIEKYAKLTIAGNHALWNALLTMNTIIITVFTVAMAYVDRNVQVLLLFTIILALVSAALTIINFRVSRNNMKYQGHLAMGLASQMSREERAADIERAKRSHNWTVRREGAVELITLVQGILIVLLVGYIAWSSQGHPR